MRELPVERVGDSLRVKCPHCDFQTFTYVGLGVATPVNTYLPHYCRKDGRIVYRVGDQAWPVEQTGIQPTVPSSTWVRINGTVEVWQNSGSPQQLDAKLPAGHWRVRLVAPDGPADPR